MAEIKSYSDLKQSKKLAEILPLESADMFYPTNSDWEGKIIGLLDVPLYIGSDGFVDTEMGEIHAWSLAALLDILDYPQLSKDKLGSGKEGWMISVYPNDCRYDSCWHDNPVDACYEMIIKLNERKML